MVPGFQRLVSWVFPFSEEAGPFVCLIIVDFLRWSGSVFPFVVVSSIVLAAFAVAHVGCLVYFHSRALGFLLACCVLYQEVARFSFNPLFLFCFISCFAHSCETLQVC